MEKNVGYTSGRILVNTFMFEIFMRIVSILLIPLFMAVCAAQTAEISDPFSGSVERGFYRNAFFGFSCKLPSGWYSNVEAMQSRLSRHKTDGALTQEFMADLKERGILLSATPAVDFNDLQAQLRKNRGTYTMPAPTASLLITIHDSRKLQFKTANEFVNGGLEQMKSNSRIDVLHFSEPITVSGVPFARAGYRLRSADGQAASDRYWYQLVTMRNGYFLSFAFSSRTQKETDKLVKIMDSVRFRDSDSPR
jgi:hypothetical protein